MFSFIVGVISQGQRQLWGRRDSAGQPDDGNHANQHVDNLSGRRARIYGGIGLGSVGGHSTTDRDQRGEPYQLQRLRIQPRGIEAVGAEAVFGKACVIDGHTAKQFPVVQDETCPFHANWFDEITGTLIGGDLT